MRDITPIEQVQRRFRKRLPVY